MDTVTVAGTGPRDPAGPGITTLITGLHFNTLTVHKAGLVLRNTLSLAGPSPLAKLTQMGHHLVHAPSTPHLISC